MGYNSHSLICKTSLVFVSLSVQNIHFGTWAGKLYNAVSSQNIFHPSKCFVMLIVIELTQTSTGQSSGLRIFLILRRVRLLWASLCFFIFYHDTYKQSKLKRFYCTKKYSRQTGMYPMSSEVEPSHECLRKSLTKFIV